MSELNLPTFADVVAASERIAGVAHATPVKTSRTINEQLGAEVFFKCENMQRMGAFKFRGGYNSLAKFTPEQRKAGVVAFSSGNHAQAIALSASCWAFRPPSSCRMTRRPPRSLPPRAMARRW
jgi:threonine dehydratase